MFHQTSGNPFEEESLPKAHYFPSLERDISANQRKTCLSPKKENADSKKTSKADAKFLRESNKLEVPTREDGTVKHEVSSGSQFDESWPSTDRNVSSLSQPSSSSTPAEKENSDKDLSHDKLSCPSTLSKYIQRFRHSAPTSREDRTPSGQDFWWLSPPSNTSTPKESSDTSKFSNEGSSKMTRNTTSVSPPRQKYEFKRHPFSRPVRETVTAMDSTSTDLLARTNLLLEKSDNTLSEVSSESIPKPPSSWMIEKQKRLDDAMESKKTVVRPRLAPEDDILYQWRLARRLENAQKEAKDGEGKRFSNIATHRYAAITRGRYGAALPLGRHDAYLPEQDHSRHLTDTRDRLSPKHVSRKLEERKEDKGMDHATDDIACRDKRGVSASNERELSEQGSKEASALERNVPAVCFIDEEKIPSHVHMMCDIVPCSKQTGQQSRDVNVSNHDPRDSDCRIHRNERSPKARPGSPDILDKDSGSNIRVEGETDGLANAVSGRTKKDNENKESDPRMITSKNSSETAEARSEREIIDDSEKPQNDRNELEIEEKTDFSHLTMPREDFSTDKHSMKSDENETKLEISMKGNDTPAPVPRPLPRTEDVQNPGIQLTDVKNNDVIGSVIGQVISERLFSPTSSRRSSLSSSCSEYGDVEGKKETNVASTSYEYENQAEQESKSVTPEILFPDDDILHRLREQANFYKEHLRNIDRILQHLTE
ncbi:uncharacterized protein LOC114527072 [Dendronephthya gigantea]|uniref:uncharacterized protein LOC114527072 n=1 Tax=Dendronephthya gigantea TaxID=151771 RepID=UPI00106C2D68|nr:uncharacterized protein LOC114527072 [Dendronephthya gigantea]